MPAEIDVEFSGIKQIRKIQKDFIKLAPNVYKKAILGEFAKGRSPVHKGRWDVPYSDSYTDAINAGRVKRGKQASPVNLKVEGDLWDSLEVTPMTNGMEISFDSEIADFHNRRGAGASGAIRRMLPTKSREVFNKTVETKIDLLLRKVVKQNL